jgi:hypothetical protein
MKLKLDMKWKLFFIIFVLLLLFDAVYISYFKEFFNTLFKEVQGGRSLSIKYGPFGMTYLLMTIIIYHFGFTKHFTDMEMFF